MARDRRENRNPLMHRGQRRLASALPIWQKKEIRERENSHTPFVNAETLHSPETTG